jgi:hypothetical protein
MVVRLPSALLLTVAAHGEIQILFPKSGFAGQGHRRCCY